MKRMRTSCSTRGSNAAAAPLGALAAGFGFMSLSSQEFPVAESKSLPPITVKY